MSKFLLIPDSFKGTMSSEEICSVMEQAIKSHCPDSEIISVPVADGGEGSVDAFLKAVGGERIAVRVKGPYFNDMDAFYGIINNGKTAIIEMAACAGLPLVEGNPDPKKTTTYGVGQLIEDAARRGCEKIIIGLGGSCTNDAGTGAAAALGVTFTNQSGNPFIPAGGTLKDIVHIDTSNLLPALKKVEMVAMCDIDNPLFGENGAAYVFGPQKGADEAAVKELDEGLRNLDRVLQKDLKLSLANEKGAGAAGGMGCGMVAFCGASLRMGIETVLDTVSFDSLVQGVDYVFTGEGKLDSQSLRGKVVIGVAHRAKKSGVPVIAVVGDIGEGVENVYSEGVTAVFSINNMAIPFREAKLRSKYDLALTMDNLMRLLSASRH
ncbi:glycerate kinase [Acetanaerobacterium elongatum]|uniref:Glycerate kinase n=1 Tax=Acetanaerobacterium elongatum TaxID=258515 RepID=A0A1G9U8A9_9FIRM|nr:glycerate kinase [Acetanaerobacterium elongatum]SDM56209.1 glycerate kinase [Acetanaerobacterium elongatum]